VINLIHLLSSNTLIAYRWLPLAKGLQVQAHLPAGHPVWLEEMLEIDRSPCKDGAALARADSEERLSAGQ
jgi:hypothetical protein